MMQALNGAFLKVPGGKMQLTIWGEKQAIITLKPGH